MTLFFDDFEFDAESLELRREGKPVKSDALLLRVLAVLAGRAGQLITKQDLVISVWGGGVVTDNAVTVAIARLRKLLGHERETREMIVTLHGRGYRFVRPVTRGEPPMLAAARTPALGERQARAPFVGRERMMKQLRGALDEAREGRGSARILIGEPGIGKTRAVELLAAEAAEAGVPVAWGYCREVGDTPPLWPFAQLIRALLAKVPLDPSDAHFRRVVPQLKRVLPELADAGPFQSEPGQLRASPVARYKIFDATARVLAMAARHTPCVLILDDLHRADPGSLELLRYFIDELAITRIALYATVRSSENLHPHLEYVLGHRNVARLLVDPLGESEVAAYVTGVLREPHPALARAVFLKSEGNPFFMTELLRHVRERDQVVPESLRVPEAAREFVRQRAAMLDDAARGVLSRAAVIGRRFDLGVLRAIGGGSASALMTTLDEAVARGVVTADPNCTTAFAFSHELLRSALYDALPRREQRALHLRVAEALEQRAAAGDTVPAADLVYHYRAALPTSDPRKVVHYCRQAARDATSVHAYSDGARYMSYARDALDLIDEASPRLRLSLSLQQAMFVQAQSSGAAAPLIREVIEAARGQGAGGHLIVSALLLDPHYGLPTSPDTATLLEEGLRLLPEDAAGARAAALARLATLPPLAYRADASRDALSQAQALADSSGDPFGRYVTRMAALYLQSGPDRRSEAERVLVELDRLSRLLHMTMLPTLRESQRAVFALQDGEFEAMHEAIARGEAYSRQLATERAWYFERLGAIARVNTGQVAEGCAMLERIHRSARSNPHPINELLCAYDECVVMRNPTKLPKHVLRDVFAHNQADPPGVWALKVRALSAAGLRDEALTLLHMVPPRQLAELPEDRDYLGTLGALAGAALALRAREYVSALRPLLARYPDRYAASSLTFFCEGRVADILALLEGAAARADLSA